MTESQKISVYFFLIILGQVCCQGGPSNQNSRVSVNGSGGDFPPSKLRPSISCIMLGDDGCKGACNLIGVLYGCEVNPTCRKGMYCECNELYSFQKNKVPADKFGNLSFDELWDYRFEKNPQSAELKNLIKNNSGMQKYALPLLRDPHVTGEEIKSAISEQYPQITQVRDLSSINRGEKNHIEASGSDFEYENLGQYFEDTFEHLRNSINQKSEELKYRRRLIQLLNNVESEDELRSIMRQVLMTGDDKLYNFLNCYLRKRGINFNNSSLVDSGPGRRGCGSPRRRRYAFGGSQRKPIRKYVVLKRGESPVPVDAEESDLIEVAVINELLSPSKEKNNTGGQLTKQDVPPVGQLTKQEDVPSILLPPKPDSKSTPIMSRLPSNQYLQSQPLTSNTVPGLINTVKNGSPTEELQRQRLLDSLLNQQPGISSIYGVPQTSGYPLTAAMQTPIGDNLRLQEMSGFNPALNGIGPSYGLPQATNFYSTGTQMPGAGNWNNELNNLNPAALELPQIPNYLSQAAETVKPITGSLNSEMNRLNPAANSFNYSPSLTDIPILPQIGETEKLIADNINNVANKLIPTATNTNGYLPDSLPMPNYYPQTTEIQTPTTNKLNQEIIDHYPETSRINIPYESILPSTLPQPTTLIQNPTVDSLIGKIRLNSDNFQLPTSVQTPSTDNLLNQELIQNLLPNNLIGKMSGQNLEIPQPINIQTPTTDNLLNQGLNNQYSYYLASLPDLLPTSANTITQSLNEQIGGSPLLDDRNIQNRSNGLSYQNMYPYPYQDQAVNWMRYVPSYDAGSQNQFPWMQYIPGLQLNVPNTASKPVNSQNQQMYEINGSLPEANSYSFSYPLDSGYQLSSSTNGNGHSNSASAQKLGNGFANAFSWSSSGPDGETSQTMISLPASGTNIPPSISQETIKNGPTITAPNLKQPPMPTQVPTISEERSTNVTNSIVEEKPIGNQLNGQTVKNTVTTTSGSRTKPMMETMTQYSEMPQAMMNAVNPMMKMLTQSGGAGSGSAGVASSVTGYLLPWIVRINPNTMEN